MSSLDSLRYPIGSYKAPETVSPIQRAAWIEALASYPDELAQAVAELTEAMLDQPYRPEGWTLRQVVHHVADSHANGYIRFKWSLTEDTPEIKAYAQGPWAELPDSQLAVDTSLQIISGIHDRWVGLLNTLTAAQWAMGYIHPEDGKVHPLDKALGLYVWHGQHHLAHLGLVSAS